MATGRDKKSVFALDAEAPKARSSPAAGALQADRGGCCGPSLRQRLWENAESSLTSRYLLAVRKGGEDGTRRPSVPERSFVAAPSLCAPRGPRGPAQNVVYVIYALLILYIDYVVRSARRLRGPHPSRGANPR